MTKIDLDDISIVPAITSKILSRKECYPRHNSNGKLPIIVSPMDTVIDKNNFNLFNFSNLISCIPRQENYNISPFCKENYFKSYGLNEIKNILYNIVYDISEEYGITIKKDSNYINSLIEEQKINSDQVISKFEKYFDGYSNILIDIANGHMEELINIIKLFNSIARGYGKIYVGNIAHPETYKVLAEAGAHGVRLNVGPGQACLTAQNTAIFYPIASLIKECKEIKTKNNFNCLIISDGGCKNYADIIKCLALGADYVMLGSLINKSIESAGQKYIKLFKKYIPIKQTIAEYLFRRKYKVYVKYRGMSSKEVQKKWNKDRIVTAEGTTRIRLVEYTLKGFLDNFCDYLKSAMSYTNCKTLEEFIGGVQIIEISNNSYKRFNK